MNTEDSLHVTVAKFRKMIEVVAQVRKAQNQYFSTKKREDLVTSKTLEASLDKAIDFYIKNREDLHDCPF